MIIMSITMATATEMQNNFGRYMNMVTAGEQIIITKNGREIGRLIPKEAAVSSLTDSLTGILKGNFSMESEKDKALEEKYEISG